MPKSTSAIPDRVHCGCDLCQRNGKQLVPRSTYRRHKMHRNNGLSAQFNQFINAQMRISESETPNSHSDDDIPMPFNSEDDIDDVAGVNNGGPSSAPDALSSPGNQSSSRPTADADQNDVGVGSHTSGVGVSFGQVEDDQGEESSDEDDLPDPGSRQLDDRLPIPSLPDAQRDEEESRSGLDLEELCGLAETTDIKLVLDFIAQLQNASLEDDGMRLDSDLLERLRNPVQEELDIDDPDLRLALDLFLAVGNSSQQTYHDVRKAILRRYPNDDVLTFDQIKRRVAQLSGVTPLVHDMCINTCIAYTGPLRHLEICPHCNEPRYDPIKLTASDGKIKEARQEFHTIPIGPQLQALYRSKDGAERMHYRDIRTEQILAEIEANNGSIPVYEDLFHGSDYLQAVDEGRIKEGDPVLMFSIDGAQLYQSKASDCWIYIWVVFNHDPVRGRYIKKHVWAGAVIPGPNKPKFLESYLFPGLHHLSAIQREGLVIWDASRDTLFTSHPFLALATADGPAMASINGLVGHQGRNGCRLYCPLKGRRKPNGTHYYPALLKPIGYIVDGCDHPDVLPSDITSRTFENYDAKLKYLVESSNDTQYKKRRLETGIVKPGIFLGLPQEHILTIPRCFGYDIMHLVSLNIPDLLISLWRGTIDCDKDDDRNTWGWAVLRGNTWTAHGQAVASMTPYLPGSFDRPPRNPAEKINSGYKAWEFLMYIFGLGPGLFYNVLPRNYWRNFCKLVFAVRVLHQHKIPAGLLQAAHQALLEFVVEFEVIYCQRRISRIHFVRPCLHTIIHAAPEVIRAGPGMTASQWTMERAIGDLGGEIRQPSNPYANLSQRAVRRCQVNALKAMIPDLEEPAKILPRGAQDLKDGYILLRAKERNSSLMREVEAIALRAFYQEEGQNLPDGYHPSVYRWGRLRVPTGQVARSAWKEKLKTIDCVRMARNVKLNILGKQELAEAQYYFQMVVKSEQRTLALVSLYSPPDQDILAESHNTLWICRYQGDQALKVVDIKTITAVVSLPCLPGAPEGTHFLVEKPGLDVAHMGGQDEVLAEE